MRRTFLYGFLWVGLLAVVFLLISNRHGPSAGGPMVTPPTAGQAANTPVPNIVKTAGVPASAAVGVSASAAAPAAGPAPIAAQAGELVVDTNVASNLPAEIVLRNVRHAVQEYGQMFGGDPVGINSEITAALAGQNPKHINFIDPSAGMQVNAKGELVDPWGTPYFFHQLSGSDMEIHSAGPDRIMWTSDDLVTR
jgi:hypothetical protein